MPANPHSTPFSRRHLGAIRASGPSRWADNLLIIAVSLNGRMACSGRYARKRQKITLTCQIHENIPRTGGIVKSRRFGGGLAITGLPAKLRPVSCPGHPSDRRSPAKSTACGDLAVKQWGGRETAPQREVSLPGPRQGERCSNPHSVASTARILSWPRRMAKRNGPLTCSSSSPSHKSRTWGTSAGSSKR